MTRAWTRAVVAPLVAVVAPLAAVVAPLVAVVAPLAAVVAPLVAVVAPLLAACSSSDSKPASSGDARVVPVAELPASQRAAWEAWQKGGATWEIERERVRRDPELARFVVDNLVREMVKTYDRSGFARPGGAPGRFERAQADLVELGAYSAPVLAQLLDVPDGIIAFLAGDRLLAIGASSIPHVTPLLTAERPETRRRAAELLGRLPHAGSDEVDVQKQLAQRVERDPEWSVRAESARALGSRGRAHDHKGFAMGVLVRALRDDDPGVATNAAKALETLAEPAAILKMIDPLVAAAEAGRPGVVQAIERTLGVLAGDGKRRSVEEWRRFAVVPRTGR